jgi:hypothetical protein
VIGALLILTAQRLPAPIQEAPETTLTPKPKRQATPKVKIKFEVTPKPTATANRSFAGTWKGSALDRQTNETCFLVIRISDDEKGVLINWKFAENDTREPDHQASCIRFGNALSWNLKGDNSTWHCTDTLQINANGTATFSRQLTSINTPTTFNSVGTLLRQ